MGRGKITVREATAAAVLLLGSRLAEAVVRGELDHARELAQRAIRLWALEQ